MGVAIADTLAREGALVDLILGPSDVRPAEQEVMVHPVHTAAEMHEKALALFPTADGAIMSAAVSDYRPATQASQKIKRKAGSELTLTLQPNPDIAAALGNRKQAHQVLVGFALETQDEELHARSKLKSKNLDFIVLNSLQDKGAGFGGDTNRIKILDASERVESFPLKAKTEVAADIVNKLCSLMKNAAHL